MVVVSFRLGFSGWRGGTAERYPRPRRPVKGILSRGISPFRSPRETGEEEAHMNSVAKVSEISARSDKSFEDAILVGIHRANKTLRNVASAWVKEQRVDVKDGKISGYQVNMVVTFVLDE
jgi:flavin-binding protein dodecin